MEKLKRLILGATVVAGCLLGGSFKASAAVRIVIDPWSIEAVVQNMATQAAVENMHNRRLDSIAAKQKKIEQLTVTMATIAEAYQITMQNIRGFGSESRYYIEIGLNSYEIVTRVPRILRKISRAHIPGQARCVMELTNVVAKTQQLVGDFVNIVNNARVSNPLPNGTAPVKRDGHNLLDRNDRLDMAIRIHSDLLHLRYKMQYLESLADCATWNSLFFAIAPADWCAIMDMRLQSEHLIRRWRGL